MNQIVQLKSRLSEFLPAFSLCSEEPLSRHTSFRIGGPAELMVFPHNRQELQRTLHLCSQMGIVPRLLGGGTNVLAPDEGVRGVVLVTRETFMGLTLLDETHISAMAGMSLAQTAAFAARNGLSGLEFAHGIPGTVGGGIYMNAGAYGGEMRDVAVKTEFMHLDGRTELLKGTAQGFAYRSSAFQRLPGVIVETVFALTRGQEAEIREKMRELAERRRASQPLDKPSAGSTFKRPAQGYAAALIEAAGLKGLRVGGAAVSEKHAGFVVNLGGATAADVLALMAQVQQRVYESSGVRLEPEVRLWGSGEE